MSDLLNVQVNGTPVIIYGLVGITTAVLAYATAGGEFGGFAAKTMGALSPNALIGNASESSAELGKLNPFESKPEDAKESTEEPPAETAPTEEPPAETAPTEEPPAATEPQEEAKANNENEEETKGGKKRKRKTPKKRKSRKNGKTKKRKSNKPKKSRH